MAMVFRKQYTMPLPRGAEIVVRDGQRIARWRLRGGSLRSAEVVEGSDGKPRVRGQSRFYTARYRGGEGQVVEVATGCRDEVAARAVLTQFERRAELVRAGLLTPSDDTAANHAHQPLSRHLDAYMAHLEAKGGDTRRITMVRRRLERLIRECRFQSLTKLNGDTLETWLVEQAEKDLSASTRNTYREAAFGFGNWCRRTRRLPTNPFADVPRADQNADRRHQRRALTEAELLRLLKTARLRPLGEYGRAPITKVTGSMRSPRSRATWTRQPLSFDDLDDAAHRARQALRDNPELIEELLHVGESRALMYKTLALTGLRKGELASLTVAQLDLTGPVAHVVLYAADEKNRQGSSIPLRSDLVKDISAWLNERLRLAQRRARDRNEPIPVRLTPSTPLFDVPSGLTRIFDRDLAVAGIPKRDERNRVVDVHALRVTFGTHLCAAGVPLRTAQAAMRHSKPELTANVYTDPKLLNVAGAIEALPALAIAPSAPHQAAEA